MPDENVEAYGEVVWSWRRDAGVKFVSKSSRATVAKKPVHRGERDISRKAIAQGMSVCSPLTCMLVCSSCCASSAHGTAGAARTRHSLLPLFAEGQRDCKARALIASRQHFLSSWRKPGPIRRGFAWDARGETAFAITEFGGYGSRLSPGRQRARRRSPAPSIRAAPGRRVG